MNPGSPNHDHSLIDHHNWGNFHQVNYINKIITTHRIFLGGCPGLVVMGGDSCPKVVGLIPGTIYSKDIFSHIFVAIIVMMFI